jgi:pyruvate/2-oxoglutarate dehydrogenase complex dihydrolipoamide dehydrogenase (E3) component
MKVVIIGSGTMGPGIAQVCAMAGHRVILTDIETDAIDRESETDFFWDGGADPRVVMTREASSDGVFETKNVADGRGRLVVGTDGAVLGWQGLHYHADGMAKPMQVVVGMGLDVRDIPDRAYHPTTPEILDGLFRETSAQLAG